MNLTPIIHSSTDNSVSRAKSWTCLINDPRTSRVLGVALGPIALMTLLVKSGSNFVDAFGAVIVSDEGYHEVCGGVYREDGKIN